jgi:hypothetical protein
MMRQADLEVALRTVLEILEPYRSDLVLIGGWVPYLYRHYGGLGGWDGEDALTFELDVLVSRPLPPRGRPAMATMLRDVGFLPLDGESPPAVWLRDGRAGEKIEFITVHRGMAHGLGRVVPLTEQPGIGAIPLSELEVMQSHTRTLLLPALPELRAVKVQVPTLGAYVVNKALTFVRRPPPPGEIGTPKLPKDLLYLRDLAAAGARFEAAIRKDAEIIARSPGGTERIRAAATNLWFVIDGHLSHHVTQTARTVLERDTGPSLIVEEARTRGFLRDLHDLLLDCAAGHETPESIDPDAV